MKHLSIIATALERQFPKLVKNAYHIGYDCEEIRLQLKYKNKLAKRYHNSDMVVLDGNGYLNVKDKLAIRIDNSGEEIITLEICFT